MKIFLHFKHTNKVILLYLLCSVGIVNEVPSILTKYSPFSSDSYLQAGHFNFIHFSILTIYII